MALASGAFAQPRAPFSCRKWTALLSDIGRAPTILVLSIDPNLPLAKGLHDWSWGLASWCHPSFHEAYDNDRRLNFALQHPASEIVTEVVNSDGNWGVQLRHFL